jgi:CubicO group peptidase (beta-lactamase class C family)
MNRFATLALASALFAAPAQAQTLPEGLPPLAAAKACKAPKDTVGGALDAEAKALAKGLVPAWTGSEVKPQALAKRMQALQVPGVSVALIRGGRVVLARGWGTADMATCAPVTADTLFQAGSVSKVVTATLAMQAVQAGRHPLDADINWALARWQLPMNKAYPKDRVTLRQLLSHTAGVSSPDSTGYAPGAPLPSLQAILTGKGVKGQPVRVTGKPGGAWDYSNGGYLVVQAALQDMYGEGFAALADKQVLAPAGMTRSTFAQPPAAPLLAATAAGHHLGQPFADRFYNVAELGAGGLWATPGDLARLLIALRGAWTGSDTTLLPQAAAREMAKVQAADWGLGLKLKGSGTAFSFGHDGTRWGMFTRAFIHPESGDGIVVMTNDFRGFDLADEIIRAAANRYGWAAYQSRALASLPADTVLYLRGSMNDWGTATPLRREGAGYAGEVTLPAGRHEFKLATADWDYLALGQGAGAGLKPNGGTLKLDPGGGNVVFETAAPGTWRLVLDRLATGRPRLAITPAG